MSRLRLCLVVLACVMLSACASMAKGCANAQARNFGADWIVVQYSSTGQPFHCWKLVNSVVEGTEGGSIEWQDRRNGHMMHATGWENRIQVIGGDFVSAGLMVGVDANQCDNGVYPAPRRQ